MEPWVVYTVCATVLYGGLNFLFKVAAERGHDTDGLVNVVGLAVTALALGTLPFTTPRPWAAFTGPVLGFAFFNGLFFALGSLAKYGALKRAPAAIVFTLNRLNTLGVVAIGFSLFGETPRPVQVLGIAAGLGVLAVVAVEQREHVRSARNSAVAAGIVLALGSALFTALSMTVGKLMAETAENRIAYIAASYALVFLSTGARDAVRRRRSGRGRRRFDLEMAGFGFAIGALNYAGYFLVLQAFGSGPISLSQAIFSSSIVVPILLSRWVYGEKLTPLRWTALGLALLSVALIGAK
ncbi:MAG: EamA family transporter [Kiritimatiellia bacterium]